MAISKRKLRKLPRQTRQLGRLVNDLERAAKQLRRQLSVIGLMEIQVRQYEAHLEKLRERQRQLVTPDVKGNK
jgi:prefoldin subunit 5